MGRQGSRMRDDLFITLRCPVCGKSFIKPVESIYFVKIKQKKYYLCSYTCYRFADRHRSEFKRMINEVIE